MPSVFGHGGKTKVQPGMTPFPLGRLGLPQVLEKAKEERRKKTTSSGSQQNLLQSSYSGGKTLLG